MPSPKDRFTIRPILPADHTVWMAVAFDLGRADTPIERLPPQAMRFWREKYFTNGK